MLQVKILMAYLFAHPAAHGMDKNDDLLMMSCFVVL